MTGPATIRFTGRVGDRRRQVEITRRPGGEVRAVVDGRTYQLSITEPQPRAYSILQEGMSLEARVLVRGDAARVHLGGRQYEVQPERPGPDLAAGRRAAQAGGRLTVTAVMPGRVVRVHVAVGDRVTAQKGIVVLEAMKMENELAAPRDGVVRQVMVKPGQTVETGDPLLILE